jgi:hypothetical protein
MLTPRQSSIPEEHVGESKEANRTTNGILEDFPPELRDLAAAAFEAERLSVEKGIDAWKKVVAGAPTSWPPRRELARVYKKAERWKACVEVLKEGVERPASPSRRSRFRSCSRWSSCTATASSST